MTAIVSVVDNGSTVAVTVTESPVSVGVPSAVSHNALSGRTSADAHPTSAITGLDAALAALQPLDADLTAIAGLSTTAFGRSLLTPADAAAARTLLGAETSGAAAAAQAFAIQRANHTGTQLASTISDFSSAALSATASAYQPLDADLTAIAGLSTTAYGRGFLPLADAAAALTYIGAQAAGSYQPLDPDLTGLASDYDAATKALTYNVAKAATSAGLTIQNSAGASVLLLGAGPSQGITAYGQINGTSVSLSGGVTATDVTAIGAGGILDRQAATQDGIRLLGRAGGTTSLLATIVPAALTASRTYTGPDLDGTLALTSGLTSGRVPFATTGGLLTDSSGFTWTGAILTLNGGAATSQCTISADSGFSAGFALRTAGSGRWTFQKTSTAESGSDAGSNLSITAFTDAGATIDSPISIVRAAGGAITLSRPLSSSSGITCTTVTASGLISGSTASAAFGATALVGSERLLVSGGTATTPGAGQVCIGNGEIRAAGGVRANSLITVANGYLEAYQASTGTGVVQTGVNADANPRFQVLAGGTIRLGDGTVAPSTFVDNARNVTCAGITASGLISGSAASAAIGATALVGSERVRIAGGTAPGTPGATDVLIGDGRVRLGNTSIASIQTAGGATIAGNIDCAGTITFKNTANTSGYDFGLLGGAADATAYILNRQSGANLNMGTGNVTGLVVLTPVLASGRLAVNYTTASTSTTTGALTVAGGAGFAENVNAARFIGRFADHTDHALAASCVATISGAVTDGYTASLGLVPTYNGAFAVTRHNYINVSNPLGTSTITNACLFRFDAAAGTHKAVDSATTKTTPGGVDAWVKVNINGTIHYLPAYTSKTS